MGKNTQFHNREDSERLLHKRYLSVVEASTEEEQQQVQTAEALKQKEHVEALQEFFGMSSEQADEQASQDAQERDDAINGLLADWKGRELKDKFKGLIWDQFKKIGTADKAALDEKVTGIAQKKVEKMVYDIYGEEEKEYHLSLDNHTHLALATLNAKSDVLTEFHGALSEKLKEEQKQLENLQGAIKALEDAKSWSERNLFWKKVDSPDIDEVNKRIENYTQMQKAVETLQTETKEAKGEKDEEYEKVEDKEAMINKIVLLRAPHLAPELEEAMANSALSRSRKPFWDFLIAHADELNLTGGEKEVLDDAMHTFITSNEDAYGYFLNKQYERGTLNRKEDKVETRMERVTRLSADKRLKMFLPEGAIDRFQVASIDRSKKRVFIKTERGTTGIINYSKPKEPFMTIIPYNEDAPKSFKLVVPDREGEKVSLTSVEFEARPVELAQPTSE